MKFSEMPYQRVNYEEIEARYEALMENLKAAPDGRACMEVLKQRYLLNDDLTCMELAYVRHDMNVNDEFYAAEQDYYDEIGPKLSDLSNRFDKLLLTSPHRSFIERVLGAQAFVIMEEAQRSFDSRLIPLSQEENNLMGRHNQLASNGTVLWNGVKKKRSLLVPETASSDREIRKKAALALSDSWEAQREELEELYDSLVHNRHKQARLLGFHDYMELSYHRMLRIGYGSKEVARFRDAVKRFLVPFITELADRRRRRLQLEHLHFYDRTIYFMDGNPKPPADAKVCLEKTREMYTLLSPETAEFIGFLLDNELCDVEIREGKRDGGYMASFEKYRAPFIFANFDGTSENAYIMCHEGGHAFQAYLKRDEEIRERCWYTSEAAETHAMSMEFFAWQYMELFFGERAQDYRIMHLEDAVRLIARECLQDEFQQRIYEKPDLPPAERNVLWAKLEMEYFPDTDYSGNENLQKGCGWQRIPHMFQYPFYAIDYALAQVCALEYLQLMSGDRQAAWQSYLKFCRETGTKTFPELVKDCGLDSPFEEGTLQKLAEWLQSQFL